MLLRLAGNLTACYTDCLLVPDDISSCGYCTHHRDHEEDEGQAGEPEIPEGTVLQLARPLCSGLESDHAAEQLGCDCSPASLHITTPLPSQSAA